MQYDPEKFLAYVQEQAEKHMNGRASDESLHAHLLVKAYERHVQREDRARDLTQMMIMDLEVLNEKEPQLHAVA